MDDEGFGAGTTKIKQATTIARQSKGKRNGAHKERNKTLSLPPPPPSLPPRRRYGREGREGLPTTPPRTHSSPSTPFPSS